MLIRVETGPLPLGIRHAGFTSRDIGDRELAALARELETMNVADAKVGLYQIPFYRDYEFLRIVLPEPSGSDVPGPLEAFALVRFRRGSGDIEADLLPLDGTSPIIHKINSEEGNLLLAGAGAEDAGELDKRCLSYLQFFTWAVHSDEGNFPIIFEMEELDSAISGTDVPEDQSERLREKLATLEFTPIIEDTPVDDSRKDPPMRGWRAIVAYAHHLFTSSLVIYRNGLVEMLSDNPILELPEPVNARFGEGSLIALRPQDDEANKKPRAGGATSITDASLPLGLPEGKFHPEALSDTRKDAIHGALNDKYRWESNRVSDFGLWTLPFYKNYSLLRIRERLEGKPGMKSRFQNRDAFALVKFEEQESGTRATIVPLDGTSPRIHEINAEEGNLWLTEDRSDKINSDRCRSYLCFFTWALHANEGNFAIVHSLEQLREALENVQGPMEPADLKAFENEAEGASFELEPVECPEGDEGARDGGVQAVAGCWRGLVAYGKTLFDSTFRVRSNGMVEMVSDEPKLELPAAPNADFNRSDLFTLRTGDKYPPMGRPEGGDSEEIRAEDFVAKWRDGDPDRFRVTGRACLLPHDDDSEPMNGCRQVVMVTDCEFEEPVAIASQRSELIIRFVRCTFGGGVELGGCEIKGSLEFVDCLFEEMVAPIASPRFLTPSGAWRGASRNRRFLEPSIDLRSASIGGHLRFVRCGFAGRFFAPSLKVGGNLMLQGCRVGTLAGEVRCPVILSELDEWSQRSFKANDDGAVYDDGWACVAALELSSVRIGGDLEITAAGIDDATVFRNATQELASRIRGRDDDNKAVRELVVTAVRGECHLRNAEIHGKLFLFGFGSAGQLYLAGARMGLLATVPDLKFICDRLHKDSPIWPFSLFQSVQGPICVHGHAHFAAVAIRDICQLQSSVFGGDLDLLSTRVGRDLWLFFTEVKGWLRAIRSESLVGNPMLPTLEVGGEVNLSGANLNFVELGGIKVKGTLKLESGKIGSLAIGFDWRREKKPLHQSSGPGAEEDEIKPIPSTLGFMSVRSMEVVGNVDLVGVRVGASEDEEGPERGITITQTKIGGDLRFAPQRGTLANSLSKRAPELPWVELPGGKEQHEKRLAALKAIGADDGIKNNQPSILDYPATIHHGNLNLAANRIDGYLDLSNVRVPQGRILLHDTKVGLDLIMGAQTERTPDPISYARLVTLCRGLDMEKIEVGGDADLTGLWIRAGDGVTGDGPGKETARARAEGTTTAGRPASNRTTGLLGRDAKIRGDLLLIPDRNVRNDLEEDERRIRKALRNPGGNERHDTTFREPSVLEKPGDGKSRRWHARIESGDLDLTALEAARLIVSGTNFPGGTGDPSQSEMAVRIPRARLGRLEVLEPTPGPLEMTRAEVARWSVDDEDRPDAGQFAKVLEMQGNYFDRTSWVTVEMQLRNEMRTGEAHVLYRKMLGMTRRDKIRRHHGSLLKAFRKEPEWWIKDVLSFPIGWGTRTWLPLLLWLVFFLFFSWHLSDPRNVEAGPELLQHPGLASELDSAVKVSDGAGPRTASDGIRLKRITPVELGHPWGGVDGLLLAARYGIPLANFVAHDRWEASHRRIDGCDFGVGLTGEQVGGLLAALSWVAWPLFLIGLARGTVRDIKN